MVLPQTQFFSSTACDHALNPVHTRVKEITFYSATGDLYCGLVLKQPEPSSEEGSEPEERDDAPLEDAARNEHEYVRERLREELGREPTEEEMDEWLRQHTEGY